MTGRLLDLTFGDPQSNLAAEEAIFRLTKLATLRVWENQRAVVLGRAQLASLETDLEYCLRQSIPVVRRFTAGGAVFNGPGNLNWSFFAPRGTGHPKVVHSTSPGLVFRRFSSIVIEALAACGVQAEFKEPNSIVTHDGKVSGMAAYVSRDSLLCHGTLLVDADLEEVQRVTRPSPALAERRYPRSNFTRVANTHVDGRSFFAELVKASELDSRAGQLTGDEESLVGRLVREKYSQEDWNLGDPFGSDYS